MGRSSGRAEDRGESKGFSLGQTSVDLRYCKLFLAHVRLIFCPFISVLFIGPWCLAFMLLSGAAGPHSSCWALPCISPPPGARPGLTWQRGRPVLHQCEAPVGKMRGEEGRSPAQKLFTSLFRVSAQNFLILSLSLLPLVVKGEPPASNAPTVKTTPPAPSRDLERSDAWQETHSSQQNVNYKSLFFLELQHLCFKL